MSHKLINAQDLINAKDLIIGRNYTHVDMDDRQKYMGYLETIDLPQDRAVNNEIVYLKFEGNDIKGYDWEEKFIMNDTSISPSGYNIFPKGFNPFHSKHYPFNTRNKGKKGGKKRRRTKRKQRRGKTSRR